MVSLGTFFLVVSLFWIGYERFLEIIFLCYEFFKKLQPSLMSEKNNVELIKNFTDQKNNFNGYAKEKLNSYKNDNEITLEEVNSYETYLSNLTRMYQITNEKKYTLILSQKELSDPRYRRFTIYKTIIAYALAYIIGLLLGFLVDFNISSVVATENLFDFSSLVLLDKIFLTPMLFAGGPQVIHQFISLMTRAKDRFKTLSK